MSDYKPTIHISVETAWELTDILNWMEMNPLMTEEQQGKTAEMEDEIWNGLDALYREREDQSAYFKALVDDVMDDISAMMEHQYNVRDLVELNEKQLEEAFWETIRGGYLKDIEPDKMVCLEKRPGKAPRVRLVGNDTESILEIVGAPYGMEPLEHGVYDGVWVCRVKEMPEGCCELAVGISDGKYVSLTEEQMKGLLKKWGNQQ